MSQRTCLSRARLSSLLGLLLLLFSRGQIHGQALSPDEAQRRFKMAEGFEVRLFASEPEVRQPVTMTFDDRGRLWVIQYLQYPTPAGLKPVEVDRYLRTKYDRVPEPPPKGPRGADKITILEDTDGDGRVDRTHDFATGLNLASALALGNDGVYVGQAPYLLFYPDRNHDDVPDGDPEVLLTGFGMEDAHAVVNSLQWGPDGWLYGAQGSTVTADIRGVGFQQGVWRYHPATRRFELFSEGGGNTWGLDFDRHGNVIAGTNYGEVVCLHQMQGAYHVKGFTKHGPLHNPYAYGYFEHCKHTGPSGGHVTCGGIVYQGNAFPAALQNTYIGANLLSNAIYWSALEPVGSTFKTRYLGTLLETDDMWFRPIDCLTGPDGAVYVADWYDQRANHVIPEDTWDRSNGRIWKIVPTGAKTSPPVPALSQLSGDALVGLLSHPNDWQRREARRILSERRDASLWPRLRQMVLQASDEHLSLESLWALYASGGWNDDTALQLLDHANPDVRSWTIRLIGDDQPAPSRLIGDKLAALAAAETVATVRCQLACTCKRLTALAAFPILNHMLRHDQDASDPYIPLLLWWAIESKAMSDAQLMLQLFLPADAWQASLVRGTVVERLARRYLAERSQAGYEACASLLGLAPTPHDRARLVTALDNDFSGPALAAVPSALSGTVAMLWQSAPQDVATTRLLLRLGHPQAFARALERVADVQEPQAVRLALMAALSQTSNPEAQAALLARLHSSEAEPIRMAALAALERFEDPTLADQVLSRLGTFTPALRSRAGTLLCARPAWSQALLKAVAAGMVDPKEVSVEQVRQMLAHNNPDMAREIESRWGQIRPRTPGEKQAYVPVLGRILNEGAGDRQRGHQLFTKHCAVCHTLHGEGNKIGPDLTTADRKNRDALLLNILDPSGYVRPEYVAQTAELSDGRVITGVVAASSADEVVLVDAKNQRATLARTEIERMQPSGQSLMPERLLETLSPQEVRDLFGYLQSDAPAKQP